MVTELRWLSPAGAPDAFPPPDEALKEPNGLLAVGGDLSPERLLCAYPKGIFPWYEDDQPILWWSPDPRAVLFPADLHVSRRLARTLRRSTLRLSADTALAGVIEGCAAPRSAGGGTWITPAMHAAYRRLHELGWAHSFEAWDGGELVAGLYGVAVGRVFFGESMFTRVNDASKVVLVRAVEYLAARGFELVDCQVWSAHLKSLGATTLPRTRFLRALEALCEPRGKPFLWAEDFACRTSTRWPSGKE